MSEQHQTTDRSWLGSSKSELAAFAVSNGLPAYRGEQLFDWIQKKWVLDPLDMTNLPASFRALLPESLNPCVAGDLLSSACGTRKIQVRLRDGSAVETVLIPEEGKLTQCISSQVGCSVGCTFCRSGSFGYYRNLTADEILGQIFLARPFLKPGERLSNVVFMGVGEPLHNYANVLVAWRALCNPNGLGLSARKVTISTAGVVSGIERLGRDTKGRAALAISLHAADESTRRKLVPGLKTPLSEIMAALRAYPLLKRDRYTIEMVLVAGVNDSAAHARALLQLLKGVRVKINLLPLNPHDRSNLRTPADQVVARFQQILQDGGLSVFRRKRRGQEIGAACGQLLGTSAS